MFGRQPDWRARARAFCGAAVVAVVFAGPAHAAGASCSALVADFDQNGSEDLRLVGTSAAQILNLEFSVTATTVELDCNGDGDMTDLGDLFLSLPPSTVIETVDLQLKGKDRIFVRQTAPLLVPRNLVVAFGPGGNTLFYDVLGEMRPPGNTVVDLIGSTGAEDITLTFAEANNALVQLRGDLGAGNDTVQLKTFGSWQDAAALDLDLALGTGNNTLDVRPLQPLASDSRWTLDVEGGDAAASVDSILVDPYALDRGTFLVRGSLQAGNDYFRAYLPYYSGNSRFVAAVKGGAGNDRIWVTPPVGAPYLYLESGTIEAVLEGGPGTDTLGAEIWDSDSSPGSWRTWLLGGDQSDALVSNARLSSAGAGSVDLLVHGGRGADLVYTGVVDDPAGGVMTFSPVRPLLYGGGEDDDCVDFGDDVVTKLSCEVWS